MGYRLGHYESIIAENLRKCVLVTEQQRFLQEDQASWCLMWFNHAPELVSGDDVRSAPSRAKTQTWLFATRTRLGRVTIATAEIGQAAANALTSRCDTTNHRCYTDWVPTTRPRYTITDTGSISHLLDDAQHRWPTVGDRKELLLRLAQAGHDSLQLDRVEAEENDRRARQRTALANLKRTVDWGAIRDDQAWG